MVYLKDAHGVVFHHASLTWTAIRPDNLASSRAIGRRPGRSRHAELRSDVKGVTKHLYEVGEYPGGWRARVVLDV